MQVQTVVQLNRELVVDQLYRREHRRRTILFNEIYLMIEQDYEEHARKLEQCRNTFIEEYDLWISRRLSIIDQQLNIVVQSKSLQVDESNNASANSTVKEIDERNKDIESHLTVPKFSVIPFDEQEIETEVETLIKIVAHRNEEVQEMINVESLQRSDQNSRRQNLTVQEMQFVERYLKPYDETILQQRPRCTFEEQKQRYEEGLQRVEDHKLTHRTRRSNQQQKAVELKRQLTAYQPNRFEHQRRSIIFNEVIFIIERDYERGVHRLEQLRNGLTSAFHNWCFRKLNISQFKNYMSSEKFTLIGFNKQTNFWEFDLLDQFLQETHCEEPESFVNLEHAKIYKIKHYGESDEFKLGECMMLHGTSFDCSRKILNQGFKNSAYGYFGSGVYLTESIDIAVHYSIRKTLKDWQRPHSESKCIKTYVFVNEVVEPKSLKVEKYGRYFELKQISTAPKHPFVKHMHQCSPDRKVQIDARGRACRKIQGLSLLDEFVADCSLVKPRFLIEIDPSGFDYNKYLSFCYYCYDKIK
jgi:hypothetical protein